MPKRQVRLRPKIWLMTDERLGEALLPTISALPRGSGIVFRYYSLENEARQKLLRVVSAAARRYGHILVVGGRQIVAPVWLVAGRHGRMRGALTAPVHSLREAMAAQRSGALYLFVSPVFETQSHPGAAVLGRVRFGLLTRDLKTPVIALGGMNKMRARGLRQMNIDGWAAISALAVER
jgi:thiamine-phosphate pyrophosphorylase